MEVLREVRASTRFEGVRSGVVLSGCYRHLPVVRSILERKDNNSEDEVYHTQVTVHTVQTRYDRTSRSE